MRVQDKHRLATLRQWRVRKKVSGTAPCPRMCVRFTGRNIHVQFVDDSAGVTLAAVSTVKKPAEGAKKLVANAASAAVVGKLAAEAAKAKGIARVVFDRRSAKYHGKVKALADAARAAGLQF